MFRRNTLVSRRVFRCQDQLGKRLAMNKFHVLSATIGSGALVSLGVFAAVAAQPPAESGPFVSSEMSTGVTITQSSASPNGSKGMSAAPSITGPAPLPPEEQGLP